MGQCIRELTDKCVTFGCVTHFQEIRGALGGELDGRILYLHAEIPSDNAHEKRYVIAPGYPDGRAYSERITERLGMTYDALVGRMSDSACYFGEVEFNELAAFKSMIVTGLDAADEHAASGGKSELFSAGNVCAAAAVLYACCGRLTLSRFHDIIIMLATLRIRFFAVTAECGCSV